MLTYVKHIKTWTKSVVLRHSLTWMKKCTVQNEWLFKVKNNGYICNRKSMGCDTMWLHEKGDSMASAFKALSFLLLCLSLVTCSCGLYIVKYILHDDMTYKTLQAKIRIKDWKHPIHHLIHSSLCKKHSWKRLPSRYAPCQSVPL